MALPFLFVTCVTENHCLKNIDRCILYKYSFFRDYRIQQRRIVLNKLWCNFLVFFSCFSRVFFVFL